MNLGPFGIDLTDEQAAAYEKMVSCLTKDQRGVFSQWARTNYVDEYRCTFVDNGYIRTISGDVIINHKKLRAVSISFFLLDKIKEDYHKDFNSFIEEKMREE